MEEKVTIKLLPVSKLVGNNGQIPGVPKNPRFIRDEKYDKLVESIKQDPAMFSLRELWVYAIDGGKYVVLNGNQRLKATKELGYKKAPCKIIPGGTAPNKLRAFVQKANKHYGEYDFDMLVNEWDAGELEEWGVDTSSWVVSEQDFDGSNAEVNVGDFDEEMSLTISLTQEQMQFVKEALSGYGNTYEAAVLNLLGYNEKQR